MIEVESNVVLPEMAVEISKDDSYMLENFEVATRIDSSMWADQKLYNYLHSSSDVLYLSKILITINWISRHIICKTWWRLANSLWTRGI